MSLSLVPPEEVTDLVPFRPTVPDITWRLGQPDDSVTGRVSQCGTEATLCCGSRVRLHQSQTGWLCAELCLRRQEQLLAGPFVHFRRAQRDFMAVAVQGATLGLPSLLCIFHPPSKRVVRAVHLPAPATHLAVVSGDELGRRTGGWLAVATEDRQLLLLGLCLDSVQHHANETKPLGVVSVEKEGFFSDDDTPGRPPAHLERGPLHPCLQFCDVQSLIEEDEMPIVDDDQEVTCLEWLPQLGCLGFGLSCGTVHFWDVVTLTPVFTVILPSDLPVVALAVQEPENDPRCCCYLWVAQGATTVRSATGLSCCSVATMHSVTYGSKEPGQDGRCVYKEFRNTRQVFEYPLEPRVVGSADSGLQPAVDGGPLGSRIISFRTLPPPLGPRRGDCTEDNPGVLLLLSWQLVRGDQVVGSYLSVFDMNQWYRAHMPQTFWLNAQQLCPYMGLFSLGEVVAKCGGLPLLDVRVPPSSVKKYRSPDPLVEQAHFPSSLAFSCICLTAEGTVHASFLGMQGQLLHEINLGGSECLNDATNLCARLFRVGLIDDSIGLPALQQSPAVAQGMLLDVALEHRMVGFLVACLRGDTGTTGNPADRPLLSFVLNWTWAKVTEAKAFLDELYVPLFDCSGQDVSEVVQHMAIHLEEMSILHRLLECACGMDTDHPELVGVRCDVVGLLAGHLRALLFLVHCEVLPDNHVATGLISYPYATLRASCLQARKDLGGRLLVDVLTEATLAKREEGAAATPPGGWEEYPPPSLQQATDIYLRRGLQPWAPHALTYYLLLDLSAVFVDEHPAVQENVERFLDVLSMGVDVQALVQGIWSLDHGSYREGLEHLQRAHSLAAPGLRPVLSALWGPAVRLLLEQGQASLAVLGLGCLPAPSTREELTLQLDVLLANSRVIDALELVRKHSEFAGMDQLLGSLVAVAKRIGLRSAQQQLETLLRSPVKASEEERLRGFFCELADPVWLSQAALHYLQCGRPRSALPLTTTLREIFHEGRTQQQQQRPYPALVRKRAAATVELTQSFLRIVPSAASKQGTEGGRGVLDLPVHLLGGTASAQRQRRGTTLRLASRSDATGPSTKLPGYRASVLPRPPNKPTTDEQQSASSSFSEERRRSLLRRLEAEALSILRTPVVHPWQPRARAESDSAVPAPLTTPASILKRTAVAVPPLTSTPTPMEEGDTPPTPPAVDGIAPTSAKPTFRKLRFAISDSSLSETGADHYSSTATTCSLELDQSRRNSEGMTSFTQSVSDGSNREHSSQFQTASESDVDSSTELQEVSPEPVSPPSGNASTVESANASGELDDDDQNVATKPAQIPFTLLKDRAPASQTRHLPEEQDVFVTGSPCEAVPRETLPLTESLNKDGAAADTEDDLDGTPLMDEEEDGDGSDGTPLWDDGGGNLEASCERGLHAPLDESDAFKDALPVTTEEEEGTKHSVAQTESVILHETEESTVTSPTPLGSDPRGSAVEQVPDSSSEEELAMPRPVVEFAGSGTGGETGLVEQVTEASASEASDSGKSEDEDDDAVALPEKSEALPNPDGTESQEADRSRSPVATNDSDREEGCGR
ncbi:protein ELYS-like [Haemaphysalis longicornis]